jgi:hypothetical protein
VPTHAATGITVTINGTGFGTLRGSSTVTFGGTAVATYVSWGATQIRSVVPVRSTGAANVVVTVGGIASNAATFTVDASSTTIFDITDPDYGGSTGSANNGYAIRDAYLAARLWSANGLHSTVYFPPGTYNFTSGCQLGTIRTNDWVGQSSPNVQQAGLVKFSGAGVTIMYPRDSTRFCWLDAIEYPYESMQYKTWGNIEIDGFTIDPNYRVPGGDCGQIIWGQGNGNYDNITIRNVTVPFHFLARTAYNTNGCIEGVYLLNGPTSRTQAHSCYCTNITVEDCTIHAQGKPIAILSPSDASDTLDWNPCLFDEINIARVYTHNHHFCGTGIHLGSYGSGRSCSVIDCECHDSTDNLIEIDAFNDVTVQGCTLNDGCSGVGFTWFSYPYDVTTPTYRIIDCHYTGGANPYWTPTGVNILVSTNPDVYETRYYTVEPAKRAAAVFGQVTLGAAGTQLVGRQWGNFILEDCTAIIQNSTSEAYSSSQYWTDYTAITPLDPDGRSVYMWQPSFTLNAPLSSVRISNYLITDTGGRGTSTTADLLDIDQDPPGSSSASCYIYGVQYRTTDSGSYATVPLAKVTVTGFTNPDTDIVGL